MKRFERLRQSIAISVGDLPTLWFQRAWQQLVEAIEAMQRDMLAAVDTIEQNATSVDTLSNVRFSFVSPLDIMSSADGGSSANITIGAHQRIYDDGRTVAIPAKTLIGQPYNIQTWVYYDDAAQTTQAPAYVVTTDYTTAFTSVAHPSRHFVGAQLTASAGGGIVYGGAAAPDGYIEP